MAIPGLDDAARSLTELAKDRHRDRDETRRLLYMALVAPFCKRYNLAGTLINALRHHHGIDDKDLERKVVDLINSGAEEYSRTAGETWAREQIEKLSDTK